MSRYVIEELRAERDIQRFLDCATTSQSQLRVAGVVYHGTVYYIRKREDKRGTRFGITTNFQEAHWFRDERAVDYFQDVGKRIIRGIYRIIKDNEKRRHDYVQKMFQL